MEPEPIEEETVTAFKIAVVELIVWGLAVSYSFFSSTSHVITRVVEVVVFYFPMFCIFLNLVAYAVIDLNGDPGKKKIVMKLLWLNLAFVVIAYGIIFLVFSGSPVFGSH
jgi:hypothetical protein